ncbi:MAG: hypothetical protein HYW47_07690 [Deltaproteobacteria bacterium]|nr:hypothetical protein [Deltaproteobacteria bacterium]
MKFPNLSIKGSGSLFVPVFCSLFFLFLISLNPLLAEAKSFYGYSKSILSGTAVVFVDDLEIARVPVNNGYCHVEVDLKESDNIIQVILFDEKGSALERKTFQVKALDNPFYKVELSIYSSLASSLLGPDGNPPKKLEAENQDKFNYLAKYISIVCETLRDMQLASALSSLEVIDRLIQGESLVAILHNRLGSEIGGQVLLELKKSSFPKDPQGNLDYKILNDLINTFKVAYR